MSTERFVPKSDRDAMHARTRFSQTNLNMGRCLMNNSTDEVFAKIIFMMIKKNAPTLK